MNLRNDERGVSEVVGAVMIFGLVLTLLVSVQVSAVPTVNRQLEFEHSQRVVGDFQSLDERIDLAGTTGAGASVGVESGLRYPPRMFLLNPPPVVGTLGTTDGGSVRLENLEAVDPEARDYLAPSVAPFETIALVHSAAYNEYGNAPETRYESGVLYTRYVDGEGVEDIVVDRGTLVEGRRITLVALEGDLSASGPGTVSLNVAPTSTPTGTVNVRGAGGGAPSFVVPTALSEVTWREEILATEYDPDGTRDDAYVSAIECVGQPSAEADRPCDGDLRITLEPGHTYELRMAAVGLDGTAGEPDPAYLTDVGPEVASLASDGTLVGVELRDRFNNPMTGLEVHWTVTAGDAVIETAGETDENGRSSAIVTPLGTEPVSVVAHHDANGNGIADDGEAFVVRYVSLAAGEVEGGLKDINPHHKRVVLTSSTISGNVVTATLENRGTTRTWSIEEARISFALATGDPAYADVTRTDTGAALGRMYVADDFDAVAPVTLAPGDGVTLRFEFDDNVEQSGGQPFDGLVIFTTYQTTSEDAAYQTYFVSDGTSTP